MPRELSLAPTKALLNPNRLKHDFPPMKVVRSIIASNKIRGVEALAQPALESTKRGAPFPRRKRAVRFPYTN